MTRFSFAVKIKVFFEHLFFSRTVKRLLLESEGFLKFDTPEENLKENPNEYSKSVFFEYIEFGEWGLASDVLIHIVEENNPELKPDAGFWEPFLKSQTMMKRRDTILFCLENRS